MSDVCEKCGKVHPRWEKTGIFVEAKDLESIQIILNALRNVAQALSPRNIPEDATQSQVDKWVNANMRLKIGYEALEREWWDSALKKDDNLQKGVEYTIDFGTGEFLKHSDG